MSLDEFRQQIRRLTTPQLESKIELYQETQSRGITDEIILECYQSEMERRILIWEAQQ